MSPYFSSVLRQCLSRGIRTLEPVTTSATTSPVPHIPSTTIPLASVAPVFSGPPVKRQRQQDVDNDDSVEMQPTRKLESTTTAVRYMVRSDGKTSLLTHCSLRRVTFPFMIMMLDSRSAWCSRRQLFLSSSKLRRG